MTDDIDIFLAHYGVKGMHWGKVRGAETRGQDHARDKLKERLKRSTDTLVDGITPTKIGQHKNANYSITDLKRGVKSSVNYTVKGAQGASRKAAAGAKGAVKKNKAKRAAVKAERAENYRVAKEAGYSDSKRLIDQQNVGKKGTRRIAKGIVKGDSVGKARAKEYASSTAKGLGVGAAILATPVILSSIAVGALAVSQKRGAAAAANLLADSKGLTSYATVALSFDKTKGSFGL